MRLEETNLVKPIVKNQSSKEYYQPSRRYSSSNLANELRGRQINFRYDWDDDWYDLLF